MKRITVFCGSSCGHDEIYSIQADLLGKKLAVHNIELVYGGARVGLMGVLADGILGAGGKAIGVLPNFLKAKELAHQGLSELIIVESMHDRKAKMNELTDGVIALPGGFGTIEELFEMLTWAQLGLHQKPIAILNINGYFNSLISFLDGMAISGFLKEINKEMLLVDEDIDDLLSKMQNYVPSNVAKWISKDRI